MVKKLTKALDEVLVRVASGENIEVVLVDYPKQRERLHPLVQTAVALMHSDKPLPSPEFKNRVLTKIAAKIQAEVDLPWWRRLGASLLPSSRSLMPVALTVLLIMVVSATVFFGFNLSDDVAAKFHLDVLQGTIEVLDPEGSVWIPVGDNEVLPAGAKVRTAEDGRARLNFGDGSTLVLEPRTEVSVDQIERFSESETLIVVTQTSGMTVTRAAIQENTITRFELSTRAVIATAESASFIASITEDGETTIRSLSGEVEVSGVSTVVTLTPGYETKVKVAEAPARPNLSKEEPLPTGDNPESERQPSDGTETDGTDIPDSTSGSQPGRVPTEAPETEGESERPDTKETIEPEAPGVRDNDSPATEGAETPEKDTPDVTADGDLQ